MSEASGKLPGMDDDTRRRLLRAVLGEDQPGRGQVRRWTALEVAERAGLILAPHQRRVRFAQLVQSPPRVAQTSMPAPARSCGGCCPAA